VVHEIPRVLHQITIDAVRHRSRLIAIASRTGALVSRSARKKLTCSGHAANSRRYRDLGSTCLCRGREWLDLNSVAKVGQAVDYRFIRCGSAMPVLDLYEGAMRLISHSGRTRSFHLSKLIARVTARGDRSGEREPCTSYRLFGELCAGSSRRVTGLSCITCAAPARNGSSGTDRSARDKRFRFTELISAEVGFSQV
jgi:hypothetical protein